MKKEKTGSTWCLKNREKNIKESVRSCTREMVI